MNDAPETASSAAAGRKEKRETPLSKDGKWKSFPKVPNLLQYVSTGTYFARVKVDGKVIRQSLDTKVFTTAKERLPDFIKRNKTAPAVEGTFGEALGEYRRALSLDVALSEQTKRYRDFCVKALLNSWRGLEKIGLKDIEPEACQNWAKGVSGKLNAQYFNNVLGTFRAILRQGGLEGKTDPTRGVKRLGVKPKALTLPSPEQFKALLAKLQGSNVWRARAAAATIQIVAYSGCRISEARKITWGDIDWENGFIRVQNAKLRNASNHARTREVPIIDEMRQALERIKPPKIDPAERLIPFANVERSLTAACKAIGIPRITHHDLRHIFATRAIQSGVDVPTVANWLGHKDGGALALKTYTHHQRGHSAAMAAKVKF